MSDDWYQVTPSTGKRTKVSAPNMNLRGYRNGQRLLIALGAGHKVGPADLVSNSGCRVCNCHVPWSHVLGVVPERVTDEEVEVLSKALRQASIDEAVAVQAARETREKLHRKLLREAGVR